MLKLETSWLDLKKNTAKQNLKLIFIIYIWLTALLGTIYWVIPTLEHSFSYTIPQETSVPLGNGFVYKKGYIYGQYNALAIDGYVVALKTYGKTVYGYRDLGYANAVYRYFICNYEENCLICAEGENSHKECAKNQDYNDIEFKRLLKEKGLPPFVNPKYKKELLTVGYMKKKLTFQNAPPSPFWKNPKRNFKKIIEPIEYITILFFFALFVPPFKSYIFAILYGAIFCFFIIKMIKSYRETSISKEKDLKKVFLFLGKKLLVFPFKLYIYSMSIIATFLIIIITYSLLLKPIIHNKTPYTVNLQSGFQYIDNPNVYGGKIITDADGNVVVHENVKEVKSENNIIYGLREGIGEGERLYFICTYGEDCSNNQNMDEEEFDAILLKYKTRQ